MAEDKNPVESTALTLKDLRKFVEDTVTGLVKGGTDARNNTHDEGAKHTEEKFTRNSNIADEVTKQVVAIRDREKKEAKDSEIETKLADLGKKLEVVPVERGRLHRFMGWGE
jgi:hypothetical protein